MDDLGPDSVEAYAKALFDSLDLPVLEAKARVASGFALSSIEAYAKIDDLTDPTLSKINKDGRSPALDLYWTFNQFYASLQAAHPSVAEIQSADLSHVDTEVGLELNSVLFKVPHTIPWSEKEYNSAEYVEKTYLRLCDLAYGPTVSAAELSTKTVTEETSPSKKQFIEACRIISGCGFEFSAALRGIQTAVVVFGTRTDKRGDNDFVYSMPTVNWIGTIWEFADSLTAAIQESDAPRHSLEREIALLALWELISLAWTLELALRIHLNEEGFPHGSQMVTDALMTSAATPGLPIRRAIAAEYAGYVYHRTAAADSSNERARDLHIAAASSFFFAFNYSSNTRLPKYIAQNILDTALPRQDQSLITVAESIWIDHYIMPHVIALTRSDLSFTKLGWNTPIHPVATDIPIESIPAYQADPTFLYRGTAGHFLSSVPAGFAADMYGAAIILIQRSIAYISSESYSDIHRYPIFAPGIDGGTTQFPMRDENPIAWFFYMADRLLKEHRGEHPHAGLTSPVFADWDRRQELGRLMSIFLDKVASPPRFARAPKFEVPTFEREFLQSLPSVSHEKWRHLAAAWNGSLVTGPTPGDWSQEDPIAPSPQLPQSPDRRSQTPPKIRRQPSVAERTLISALGVAVVAPLLLFLVGWALFKVPDPHDAKSADFPPNSRHSVISGGQIPNSVRFAVIANEDPTFYTNPGFDLINFTSQGSTISQQYARRLIRSGAVNELFDKYRAFVLAVKLSKTDSKDEILDNYINSAYFGRNCYGIESASRVYFGHAANKLTLSESAMLGGMIDAPARFDPQVNPGIGLDRWNASLDKMVQQGWIATPERDKQVLPHELPPK